MYIRWRISKNFKHFQGCLSRRLRTRIFFTDQSIRSRSLFENAQGTHWKIFRILLFRVIWKNQKRKNAHPFFLFTVFASIWANKLLFVVGVEFPNSEWRAESDFWPLNCEHHCQMIFKMIVANFNKNCFVNRTHSQNRDYSHCNRI